jgi:hypothetical protein
MSARFTRFCEWILCAPGRGDNGLKIGAAESAFLRGFFDSFRASWANLHIVIAHIHFAEIWKSYWCLS